jgi:hypothetical protein
VIIAAHSVEEVRIALAAGTRGIRFQFEEFVGARDCGAFFAAGFRVLLKRSEEVYEGHLHVDGERGDDSAILGAGGGSR